MGVDPTMVTMSVLVRPPGLGGDRMPQSINSFPPDSAAMP